MRAQRQGTSLVLWLSIGLGVWVLSAVWFLWPASTDVEAKAPHTPYEIALASRLRTAAIEAPKKPMPPPLPVPDSPAAEAAPVVPSPVTPPAEASAVARDSWQLRKHPPPPMDAAIVGSTWPAPDPRMLALRRANDPNFPPKQSRKHTRIVAIGPAHFSLPTVSTTPSPCLSGALQGERPLRRPQRRKQENHGQDQRRYGQLGRAHPPVHGIDFY
jgi:hypothetical protein